MFIEYEACDLILFVGDQRLLQEGRERQIGQCHLGRHTLFGGLCRDPGQIIAGASWRRFGH